MISTPNCCAVRASLTRDEMRIAACSETSAAAGATSTISISVRALAMAAATPGAANSTMPPKYSARPTSEIASVGDQRAQHLGGEQLERGDRRREQRFERARLLLADDRVRRQRHRAGNRRQQEQHQELLEQEQLHARVVGQVGVARRRPRSPSPGRRRRRARGRSTPAPGSRCRTAARATSRSPAPPAAARRGFSRGRETLS